MTKTNGVLFLSLCFLTILLFSATASAAEQCNNPLFARANSFWKKVLFLDTPTPYSGNSEVCSFIPSGTPQCCSDTVYTAISNTWLEARQQFTAKIEAFEASKQKLKQELQSLDDTRDQIKNSNELTDDQKDALLNFIDAIQSAFNKFVDGVVSNWAKCATAVLRYYAGLVCFGCEADWDKYITITNGNYQLKLDEETCEGVGEGCSPFFVFLGELASEIAEAASQFLGGSEDGFDVPSFNSKDFCEGDCAAWICKHFIAGIDFDSDAVGGDDDDSNTRSSSSSSSSEDGGKKKREVLEGTAVSRIMGELRELMPMAKEFKRKVERSVGNGVENIYVKDGGYPAYKNGKESGLDYDVDSAASLSSWLKW